MNSIIDVEMLKDLGVITMNFHKIGIIADKVRERAAHHMEYDNDLEGKELIEKAYRIANEICELVSYEEEI